MKILQQIVSFYKKNRLIILIGLITLIAINWCSEQGNRIRQTSPSAPQNNERSITEDQNPAIERPQEEPTSHKGLWLPYLLMVGMVLLVFVAKRRGWIEKIFPGMVIVQTKIFRSKENKRHMMRLFIINTTKSGQTFNDPIIEFMRPGSKKAFSILATGSGAFPITLTTNTSHSLTIDLDRFYEKVPELKKYRWIRMKMTINGTKVKKSLPRWVW